MLQMLKQDRYCEYIFRTRPKNRVEAVKAEMAALQMAAKAPKQKQHQQTAKLSYSEAVRSTHSRNL
jgi:hypothetical protein